MAAGGYPGGYYVGEIKGPRENKKESEEDEEEQRERERLDKERPRKMDDSNLRLDESRRRRRRRRQEKKSILDRHLTLTYIIYSTRTSRATIAPRR
ncbi:hypothetical protein KPH14_006934 [Odynerus spinipes]|uniref:Uncharacterized protein n=1 Tax=Odynerus spinipes TaxID=1348599 RepID=A0AAD9VRT8_9HYME|nr:hypothetical protein KPH14_006934 [Odynerus spinipes]